MMNDAIITFAEQFAWQPKVQNADTLSSAKHFVVLGMGGSHLAADLLLSWDATLPITVHSDYGLPAMPADNGRDTLVIASSHSGNTEEVVSGLEEALSRGLKTAVIAVGGKLINMAKEHNLPYVQMPDVGIQPRSALGYSFTGILKLMGMDAQLTQTEALASALQPGALEERGKQLAVQFKGRVPVIYTSARNRAVAYNWKIKLNETGKIPAFYNVFPELNHNEATGFDTQATKDGKPSADTTQLSERFQFVFLKDSDDHERVQKRMQILERLYRDRGLPVEVVAMTGESALEKIFSSLILADWIAFYTAEQYGLESEQVPLVEEFKDLMKQ